MCSSRFLASKGYFGDAIYTNCKNEGVDRNKEQLKSHDGAMVEREQGRRNTCRVWGEAGSSRMSWGGTTFCVFLDLQILVWHTRTEKPVLVNEGKKGFTDPSVEI